MRPQISKMFFNLLLASLFSLSFASAYDNDLTFTVPAGKTECFYVKVLREQVIDVEYQVIDATTGDLDISFQLADPRGQVIVGDYKKSENSHRHTAALEGDYRLCFANDFSTFSHKTVFMDIMIVSGSNEVDNDYEDKEMELGTSQEVYMMRVRDISEAVTRVRDHVSAARRLQELLSAHEARDRNLAEDMCDRVLTWSVVQIVLMALIGVMQVIFVKSLFDEKGGPGGVQRYLPSFITQSHYSPLRG